MSLSITLDTYTQATAHFVDILAPIHQHIHALYLFGSYARGEAIPGYSDLDFWLFFKPILWQDEKQYLQMLTTLNEGMLALQQFGIPLYHFCGFESIANLHQLPPLLTANLRDKTNCRLLFGHDIRDRIPETAVGNHVTTFFEMRRQLYLPILPLLEKKSLNQSERMMIYQALQYVKYLPEAICASLNYFPSEAGAEPLVLSLFPSLDLSPIKRIKQVCIGADSSGSEALLQETAVIAIQFVESLHEVLVSQLHHEQ